MLRIGIDTGGTFTDFVAVENGEIVVFKLPSTPNHPERAVLEGLSRIIQDGEEYLIQHGSTVATNALLERKGARTVLVTNQGFEDILEIGRQNRPALYQLSSSRPEPLVPSRYRLGIKERTLWDGRVLLPLKQESLDWLRSKVEQLAPESIALVLLYSYLNPEDEERIAQALRPTRIPVSLSHQILPEFREYERTSATVINAYLTPLMSNYLAALVADPLVQKGKLTIMQSNGGSIPAQAARCEPVRTLLSGPAGGVLGAFALAREAGYEKIITFDMGGTSTDVCLCDGQILTTNEASIDHLPVPVRMLGVHTVGAGGGSIAWIDSGGLLRVGPQSAGADPGPVCYGKGQEVTVTDANILLGRMDPDYFLGGGMKLLPERIRPAMEALGEKLAVSTGRSWSLPEIAAGVLQIVNTQVEGALRVISLQKGYDTRDFNLVSFGGAGGLHACDLARALLLPRVLVPANPGLLSATGILRADGVRDISQTVMLHSQSPELKRQVEKFFEPVQERVRKQLVQEGFSEQEIILKKSLDARYVGQAYEINLPFAGDFLATFHRLHTQFYGYCNPQLPVEIVNVRVRGVGKYARLEIPRFAVESKRPPDGAMIQEKRVVFDREPLATRFYLRRLLRPGNHIAGPAVLLEYSATTLIPPDFRAQIDEWQNIVIEPKT